MLGACDDQVNQERTRMTKVKILVAATALALSGAASSATIADGVAAQFVAQNGTLALLIKNTRTDTAVRVDRVTLLLPQHTGEKTSEVAYQTESGVSVAPGHNAVVQLLPVQRLVEQMQGRGDAPSGGYSHVFVENDPNGCVSCKELKNYSAQSAGFGAQTVIGLNGNTTTTTLFGGYLFFANQ